MAAATDSTSQSRSWWIGYSSSGTDDADCGQLRVGVKRPLGSGLLELSCRGCKRPSEVFPLQADLDDGRTYLDRYRLLGIVDWLPPPRWLTECGPKG